MKPGIQELGTECGERREWGECRQTFRGMSQNISGNVPKHSGKCRQTFRKHFGECSQTIQRIFEKNLGHVVKHTVESMKAFG